MTKRPDIESILELTPPAELLHQQRQLELAGVESIIVSHHDAFCEAMSGKFYCDCSPTFRLVIDHDSGVH